MEPTPPESRSFQDQEPRSSQRRTLLADALTWIPLALAAANRDYVSNGASERLARLLSAVEQCAGRAAWVAKYEIAEASE
jgi:hypothetical protein